MSNDPSGDTSFRSLGAWRRWSRRIVMSVGSIVLVYCWFRTLTVWLAFGAHARLFYPWLAATIGSLLTMIGLAAWDARSTRSFSRPGIMTYSLAVAWTFVSAAAWYAFGSPFSREAGITIAFAITSWWLLWSWLMFYVSWRWLTRLSLWMVLILAVAMFLVSSKADGLDGNAMPRVVWRFGTSPLVSAAAVAAEPSPIDAAISDMARTETAPSRAAQPDGPSDYPRFRGADGLATVRGAHLARDWSKRPPIARWRHPVGYGWSGFAVAGGDAITQEQRGDEESVVCYDRATGRERWVHRDAAHYTFPGTGDGPRATPCIEGQRVYSLGATGLLDCVNRETGELVWRVNVVTDNKAQAPGHGLCGSPLVVGDAVVVSAGGADGASLVAYDKSDGHRLWRGGGDPAGYASPSLLTLAGEPQIVIVNAQTVASHDPRSGAVLWSVPWSNDTGTNCSQPFPLDDRRLFVSTDYGRGCTLLDVTRASEKWQVQPLWASRTMQTKFCSAVLHEGHAYGMDDGILECVSLENGKRRWKQGRYGHGQLLLADDLLIIQAEDGRVVLVEAAPERHRELGDFAALQGKTWNNPALAGRYLFVRNDREAACYELPIESP